MVLKEQILVVLLGHVAAFTDVFRPTTKKVFKAVQFSITHIFAIANEFSSKITFRHLLLSVTS
jgi:hypothetical protein